MKKYKVKENQRREVKANEDVPYDALPDICECNVGDMHRWGDFEYRRENTRLIGELNYDE